MTTRDIAYLGMWLAFFAGCSVINAPDDIIAIGGDGDGDGDGDMGGNPGDGDGDGGTGGMSGDGDGDTGGTQGDGDGDPGGMSGDGDGDTGGMSGDGDGDMPTPPTEGLLVLAGYGETQDDRLLVAVDPDTGSNLGQLETPAVAVAYDGAEDRYYWYVFTAADLPDDALYPTRLADLQVLRFDDDAGEFVEISRTSALPPPRPDTLVALNDRLAYLSYQVDGTPVESYTVLDTTDPEDILEIRTEAAAAGQFFVGLVGLRGSAVDRDAVGGTLDLMIADNCTDTMIAPGVQCSLTVQPIRAAGSVSKGVAVNIGEFVGLPQFASGTDARSVHAALHRPEPVNAVVLSSFDPEDPGAPADVPTPSTSQDLGGLSVLECESAGMFTEGMNTRLRALNLSTAIGQQATLSHSGASVYADFFGNGVFTINRAAVFESTDPTELAVVAFDVAGSGVNVSLAPRAGFEAPNFIVPITGATRHPVDTSCPE